MTHSLTYPALDRLVRTYPALAPCLPDMEAATTLLIGTFRRGGKLLLAGNGGSAADCLHIAGELLKGFNLLRPLPAEERAALAAEFGEDGDALGRRLQQGLPAIALPGEVALTSAVANDIDAELIYAQGVMALGACGDVLCCLSTSGNARNLVAAARVARRRSLAVIGLTGKGGGLLAPLCDIAIIAPGDTTPAVQEYHLPIYHALCAAVEEVLFAG